METISASLAICAGNSPVTGEFPAQRPVARSFDDFSDLHQNKQLSKQSWVWWFEMPSCTLWRHCNVSVAFHGSNQQNFHVLKELTFSSGLSINRELHEGCLTSVIYFPKPKAEFNISARSPWKHISMILSLQRCKVTSIYINEYINYFLIVLRLRVETEARIKIENWELSWCKLCLLLSINTDGVM